MNEVKIILPKEALGKALERAIFGAPGDIRTPFGEAIKAAVLAHQVDLRDAASEAVRKAVDILRARLPEAIAETIKAAALKEAERLGRRQARMALDTEDVL